MTRHAGMLLLLPLLFCSKTQGAVVVQVEDTVNGSSTATVNATDNNGSSTVAVNATSPAGETESVPPPMGPEGRIIPDSVVKFLQTLFGTGTSSAADKVDALHQVFIPGTSSPVGDYIRQLVGPPAKAGPAAAAASAANTRLGSLLPPQDLLALQALQATLDMIGRSFAQGCMMACDQHCYIRCPPDNSGRLDSSSYLGQQYTNRPQYGTSAGHSDGAKDSYNYGGGSVNYNRLNYGAVGYNKDGSVYGGGGFDKVPSYGGGGLDKLSAYGGGGLYKGAAYSGGGFDVGSTYGGSGRDKGATYGGGGLDKLGTYGGGGGFDKGATYGGGVLDKGPNYGGGLIDKEQNYGIPTNIYGAQTSYNSGGLHTSNYEGSIPSFNLHDDGHVIGRGGGGILFNNGGSSGGPLTNGGGSFTTAGGGGGFFTKLAV